MVRIKLPCLTTTGHQGLHHAQNNDPNDLNAAQAIAQVSQTVTLLTQTINELNRMVVAWVRR